MLSDVISKVLNYFISMIKFLTMAFMLICSICVPQVGIGMSSFPNNELESDAKLYRQRSVKGIDRRSDAFIVIDSDLQASALASKSLFERNNPIKSKLALEAFHQFKLGAGGVIGSPVYQSLYQAAKAILGDDFNEFIGHKGVDIKTFTRVYDQYHSLAEDGRLIIWEPLDRTYIPKEVSERFIYLWKGDKMNIIESSLVSHEISQITFNEAYNSLSLLKDGNFLQINPKTDQYVEIENLDIDLPIIKIFASNEGWDIITKTGFFHLIARDPEKITWTHWPLGIKIVEAIKSQAGYFFLDGKQIYQFDDQTGEIDIIDLSLKMSPVKIAVDKQAKKLAVGYASGEVGVHDLSNNEVLSNFIGHNSRISALEFGLKNRLYTAGLDRVVNVWNVTNENELPLQLIDHQTFITSLFVHEESQRLVVGEIDGTLKYYELRPEKLVDLLCEAGVSPLTEVEWIQYVGDQLPYEPFECQSTSDN
jgi:WD40 repeat protein